MRLRSVSDEKKCLARWNLRVVVGRMRHRSWDGMLLMVRRESYGCDAG